MQCEVVAEHSTVEYLQTKVGERIRTTRGDGLKGGGVAEKLTGRTYATRRGMKLVEQRALTTTKQGPTK